MCRVMTRPGGGRHPLVVWINAINGDTQRRCFPDTGSAYDAAAAEHPFNNTRVTLGWCTDKHETAAPTLAARVTAILTAAGYTDSRDVFPGAFLATGTGSSIMVSIPWVNGDDADRGRALKRFSRALTKGGLYVRERDCWLQVSAQSGEGQL